MNAYHNIMSQALSQMVASTISSKCDCTKQHLCPTEDRVEFSNDTMENHCVRSDRLLVYVKFQVNSQE